MHFVHKSADPKQVVLQTIRAGFEYQGQKCSACSRCYFPDNLWPQIKEGLVKEHAKLLSSRKTYDILDADSGQTVATAQQSTGALAKLLGMILGPPATTIEVRAKSDNAVLFSVRRRGLLMKKVEAIDAAGQVVGLYKAKRLSLAGGFNVYDAAGEHVAEIRGKLLKSEYQFFAPDGTTVIASVSKKWPASAKALFTSADSYAVEIQPGFVGVPGITTLVLGAAIAASALFAAAGGKAGAGGSSDDE